MEIKHQNIKFYILIPVYNTSNYVKKCLSSIINQTFTNWKAIVIDDCSTDNSFEVLKEFQMLDKRIWVYRNKTNCGPGLTRNIAINLVKEHLEEETQNYIVFIDSDDYVSELYLQSLAEIILSEKPDVIFLDVVQEDEYGKPIKFQKLSSYKNKELEKLIRHQMTGKVPWGGVRKVAKAELIFNHNIEYTDDVIGEEAIYSFKVLFHATKVAFLEGYHYHHVIRKNSQSSSYHEDPYGEVCSKLESTLKYLNIYERYKKTYYSFAFTALIVSIYRMSNYYPFKKALSLSKQKFKKYKQKYDFNLDKNSLEKRVRFILPFAKLNLVALIVLIAKVKKRFDKKAK